MNKHIVTILLAICATLAITYYVYQEFRLPTGLVVRVFNTKGVPAIFIRSSFDERVLIDGGANSAIIRYVTKSIPFFSKRIDHIVASACDTDHVSGLIDIVTRYDVGTVWINDTATTTDAACDAFHKVIKAKNIQVRTIDPAAEIPLKKGNLQFLLGSMVRMVYGSQSVFILGDTRKGVQREYLKINTENMHSDVLVLPKSISNTYISDDMVRRIQPIYVIYSAKENNKTIRAKVDPLYMVTATNRYNIQNKNTVTVFLGGEIVSVD